MGKFDDMFQDAWGKVRLSKGLTEKPVLTGPSVIHRSTAEPPVIQSKPEVYRTPDHKIWQRTMEKLSQNLKPVYEWSEEQQPGTLSRLGKLEDLCLNAALVGDHDKFIEHRLQYFKICGQLCEVYLMATVQWDSIDILSLGLGGKMVRIRLRDNPDEPLPDDKMPEFLARELPMLLVAKPEEISSIYMTREVLPGSEVISI